MQDFFHQQYFKSNQKWFVYPWSSGREQTSFWNVLQNHVCALQFMVSFLEHLPCTIANAGMSNCHRTMWLKFIRYFSTSPILNNQVLPSDLLGCVKWPFQGLNDLHLGDQRVTWKELEGKYFMMDTNNDGMETLNSCHIYIYHMFR